MTSAERSRRFTPWKRVGKRDLISSVLNHKPRNGSGAGVVSVVSYSLGRYAENRGEPHLLETRQVTMLGMRFQVVGEDFVRRQCFDG